MSDDTHHGAESPPMGAEHEDEGRSGPAYDPAAGDEGFVSLPPLQPGWKRSVDESVSHAAEKHPAVAWPPSPGHAREDCPYPAGCSGCLQEIRPPAPDEVPHMPVEDPSMPGHCRRCGGYMDDRIHQDARRAAGRSPFDELPGAASTDYQSKADVWQEVTGPDGTYMRPRQDPIDDIGASDRDPDRLLGRFRCQACGLDFRADGDTTACVRCDSAVLDRLAGSSTGEALTVALRGQLDQIWTEIAASIVSLLAASRSAVLAWRNHQDCNDGGDHAMDAAVQDLATILEMGPGEPNSPSVDPYVELLRETAEMMRVEASHLERVVGDVRGAVGENRIQGAVRRLRGQANVIARAVEAEYGA